MSNNNNDSSEEICMGIAATCCSLCCYCFLCLIWAGFVVAGFCLIVYGAICIHDDNYSTCNNFAGSVLMLIFGIIFLIICCLGCCGGYHRRDDIKVRIGNATSSI